MLFFNLYLLLFEYCYFSYILTISWRQNITFSPVSKFCISIHFNLLSLVRLISVEFRCFSPQGISVAPGVQEGGHHRVSVVKLPFLAIKTKNLTTSVGDISFFRRWGMPPVWHPELNTANHHKIFSQHS